MQQSLKRIEKMQRHVSNMSQTISPMKSRLVTLVT